MNTILKSEKLSRHKCHFSVADCELSSTIQMKLIQIARCNISLILSTNNILNRYFTMMALLLSMRCDAIIMIRMEDIRNKTQSPNDFTFSYLLQHLKSILSARQTQKTNLHKYCMEIVLNRMECILNVEHVMELHTSISNII